MSISKTDELLKAREEAARVAELIRVVKSKLGFGEISHCSIDALVIEIERLQSIRKNPSMEALEEKIEKMREALESIANGRGRINHREVGTWSADIMSETAREVLAEIDGEKK